MGLYGKNGEGDLPDYFNKDQVGGLTHWLQLNNKLGNLRHEDPYADALEGVYGLHYTQCVMTGTYILMRDDKDKIERMYQELPDDAPRDRESVHSLMSVLLMRAVTPWIKRPNIALLWMSKQSVLDRAVEYAEEWYLDAQDLAQPWYDWMKG